MKGETRLKKAYQTFVRGLVGLVTCVYIATIICLLVQVFARYVLKVPTPWSEELARYLLITTTVVGAGEVSRRGDHLGVYFVRDSLHGVPKVLLMLLIKLIEIAFMAIITLGIIQAYRISGDVTANTMKWFKAKWLFVGLGFGNTMMLLYAVRDFVELLISLCRGVPQNPADGYSAPFPRVMDQSTEGDEN